MKRTGWILNKVPNPESVADHSFSVSLMSLLLSKTSPKINSLKLVKMAIVHDLPEALIGDIPPFEISGVSRKIKRDLEDKAISEIGRVLGNEQSCFAQEIKHLCREYNEGSSQEAKLLKDLDNN
ncbi:hypothetical protein MHBO_000235 [Bonamia ostreae]|uniref:HD domain-containing protein n=1 Tax=Bonamia ostreae TaxID=126728 RepID=A0ABV2AEW0_9EUKA